MQTSANPARDEASFSCCSDRWSERYPCVQCQTRYSQEVLADCPAVYIAQAENKDQARQIHRSLWNLGYTPFLIVLLPQQIRVYTGFDYSETDAQKGLLDDFPLDDIRLLLDDFSSEAIDTGRIWHHGRYTTS